MSWYQRERGQHHVFLDKDDDDAVGDAVAAAARAIHEAPTLSSLTHAPDENDIRRQAKYILVTTGAGMGVDSGIPDFRGGQSFWDSLNHPRIKKYEDQSNDEVQSQP